MKSPIYVLGINESHGATATLLKDGRIIAAASEERFTGIKNQAGFPKNAIQYCLKEAGIKSKEIKSIDLSFTHPFGLLIEKKENSQGLHSLLSDLIINFQNLFSKYPKAALLIFQIREFLFNGIFLKKLQKEHIGLVAKKLKVDIGTIHLRDHQTCHAYSAYYSAPNRNQKEKSLVVTCDGLGDYVCSRIFTVKHDEWHEIASTPNTNSLGMLYFYTTKYLRMKPNEHEYKVMGLAPYVKQKYAEVVLNLFKSIMHIDGLVIKSKIPHVSMEIFLAKYLSAYRFDLIASGIQSFTELMIGNLVGNAIKKTKSMNVYAAGGLFMNVKANMVIANLPSVRNLFIMPSAADESTAIGAAFMGYKELCLKSGIIFKPDPLNDLYLGPGTSQSDIKKSLSGIRNSNKFRIKRLSNPAKQIAKLISKGEIVARCVGRMEFGQRALGNRSILARPDDTNVIKVINEQIKGRDFWMPFAPVILKERMNDYLLNPKSIDSPFMMLAFETKPLAKKELVAGLHAYDLTTRPQIISKEQNENYYAIVKEFEKLTGIGALLNTSFNLHGSPIVCTPKDAVYTFLNSGLNYLQLGDYLIEKLQ